MAHGTGINFPNTSSVDTDFKNFPAARSEVSARKDHLRSIERDGRRLRVIHIPPGQIEIFGNGVRAVEVVRPG